MKYKPLKIRWKKYEISIALHSAGGFSVFFWCDCLLHNYHFNFTSHFWVVWLGNRTVKVCLSRLCPVRLDFGAVQCKTCTVTSYTTIPYSWSYLCHVIWDLFYREIRLEHSDSGAGSSFWIFHPRCSLDSFQEMNFHCTLVWMYNLEI